MSNRVVYIIGLLGIMLATSGMTVYMTTSDHLGMAGDTLKWGIVGTFLWAIFKDSGSEE